jgi:hypothetical protein
MSFCNRIVLPVVAVFSLAFLVACGSSSNKATPPPTGGFSNSNLNGTYAFSTSGTDINGAPISFAGVFTANGSGGIANSGALDLIDPNLSSFLLGEAITGGSYRVGVDGRPASSGGLLTLATAAGSFTFDFVLSSNSGGLITYYDTNSTSGGTGSGTFELQSTVGQSNVDGQSYAFNVSGISSSGNPFATVGAFTLDANGQIGISTTGVMDVNSNGTAVCSSATGCPMTSGSVSVANIPGTATFTSSAVSSGISFDVYPVDATHLKFIETDGTFFTVGDAFTQSSSVPSGNNVFSAAGIDFTAQGPLVAVGLLATDGNGNVTNASTEDFNDSGTANEVTGYTGSYSALSGGRSVVTLTGFVKGDNGLGCTNCQFAAYPSSGGIQFMEVDNAGFLDGVATPQQATSFASGNGYGVNLTGLNNGSGTVVEEDDIAEFTNTSGALAGLIDFNDEGTTTFDQSYSASYAADTSGIPGRGTIAAPSNGGNSYDMVTYVVDSSTSVGIVSDGNMVALGTLSTQSSTSSSSAALRHMSAIRVIPRPKAMKAKQKK